MLLWVVSLLMLISLLQRQAHAEHEVVVLRALSEDNSGGGRASPSPEVHTLTKYYQRIGFTSERKAFEQKGLADSYKLGDLLYHTDPVCM